MVNNPENFHGLKDMPTAEQAGAAHAAAGRKDAPGPLSPSNQAYANRTVNKPQSAHVATPPATDRAPQYGMKPTGRAPSDF